jgi:hypothetical protein
LPRATNYQAVDYRQHHRGADERGFQVGVGVVVYTIVLISASRWDEIVEFVQNVLFQPFFILVEHKRSRRVGELNDEQAVFYARLLRRFKHLVGDVYYLSPLAAREIELLKPGFYRNPILNKLVTHKKERA